MRLKRRARLSLAPAYNTHSDRECRGCACHGHRVGIGRCGDDPARSGAQRGREEAIVAHAADLVRPGGHVYLVDIDATGIRNRQLPPDIEDLNSRYWQWHRQCGNDISVGLRLNELLEAAGLDRIDYQGRYEVASVPPGFRPPSWAGREALEEAGMATPDDVQRWAGRLRPDGHARTSTVDVPTSLLRHRSPTRTVTRGRPFDPHGHDCGQTQGLAVHRDADEPRSRCCGRAVVVVAIGRPRCRRPRCRAAREGYRVAGRGPAPQRPRH